LLPGAVVSCGLPSCRLLQIPQLGVCLNKVPLFDRNIMMAQIKTK
jgi:hypothetical protein